jgi:hypothetical protein
LCWSHKTMASNIDMRLCGYFLRSHISPFSYKEKKTQTHFEERESELSE